MAYMLQRRGVGDYRKLDGSYAWMFYPPPYDFLAPANSVAMPPPILPARNFSGLSGLGCGECGGTCGAKKGVGLFDSFDPTTWAFGEWALVGLTASVFFFGATSRGAERRQAKSRARVDYQTRLLDIDRKYSRKKKRRST